MSSYARRVLIVQGWIAVCGAAAVLPAVLPALLSTWVRLPPAVIAFLVFLPCLVLAKWLQVVWVRTATDTVWSVREGSQWARKAVGRALPWLPLMAGVGCTLMLWRAPQRLTALAKGPATAELPTTAFLAEGSLSRGLPFAGPYPAAGLKGRSTTLPSSPLIRAVVSAEETLPGLDVRAIADAMGAVEAASSGIALTMIAEPTGLQPRLEILRQGARDFIRSYVAAHPIDSLSETVLPPVTALVAAYCSPEEVARCSARAETLTQAVKVSE